MLYTRAFECRVLSGSDLELDPDLSGRGRKCHFWTCQESAKIWPKISSYEANIADLSSKMRLGKRRFFPVVSFVVFPWE